MATAATAAAIDVCSSCELSLSISLSLGPPATSSSSSSPPPSSIASASCQPASLFRLSVSSGGTAPLYSSSSTRLSARPSSPLAASQQRASSPLARSVRERARQERPAAAAAAATTTTSAAARTYEPVSRPTDRPTDRPIAPSPVSLSPLALLLQSVRRVSRSSEEGRRERGEQTTSLKERPTERTNEGASKRKGRKEEREGRGKIWTKRRNKRGNYATGDLHLLCYVFLSPSTPSGRFCCLPDSHLNGTHSDGEKIRRAGYAQREELITTALLLHLTPRRAAAATADDKSVSTTIRRVRPFLRSFLRSVMCQRLSGVPANSRGVS